MLNNIKIMKNERGFTIVELLIVIVVIAILAAITIVAYNGIQNRAKASAGQELASQVAKKAEAYNTIKSSYPTTINNFSASDAPEANLDNTSSVSFGTALTADSAKGGTVVAYMNPSATGGCVEWWDYSKSTSAAPTYIRVGTGGSLC